MLETRRARVLGAREPHDVHGSSLAGGGDAARGTFRQWGGSFQEDAKRTGSAGVVMSWLTKTLHRLAHPVWWEDIFPGALMATPRVVRVLQALLFGHPVL